MNTYIDWGLQKLKSITHYDELSLQSVGMFLTIPIVCLITEAFIVGWQKSSLRKIIKTTRTVQSDIACFVIHTLGLYQLVGALFTFGIFYSLYGVIQKNVALNWLSFIPNPTAQFFFMLVVGDFKNYIRHFLLHRIGWAWELHQFHHSADDFTMLTYLRSHAAETILTSFLDLFPFIIFGANFESLIAVHIAREAHQYFIHSQLNSNWGFIGRYILVSPLAHKIHHSVNPEHYGKNLGNTFIFWDRLFGTYYEPKTNEEITIGIPENPYNKSNFLKDYFTCYVRSIKAFVGLFKTV